MVLDADRASRGGRFREIQEAVGDDNAAFAERLNRTAGELGLQASWHQVRVSKVRTGVQDLSIDDMTIIARLDPEQRGWTWVAYGVAADPGQDPWALLAKTAKKKGRSA